MTCKNTVYLALTLSAIGVPNLVAQQSRPAPPHRVRVVVVVDADTQQPIADADVTDLVTKNSTKTSKDGAIGLFVPDFVKASGAMLRITKLGYDPVGALAVDPTVDTTLVVPLRHTVAKLPTVNTTANYRVDRDAGVRAGIAQRCSAEHATCIMPDQLSQHEGDLLSDFVKRSGAIIPRDDPEPQMHSAVSGEPCTPSYFVDGLPWMAGGRFARMRNNLRDRTPNIDDTFRPDDIVAIEIYRPDQPRPMRYSDAPGKEGCGAIVVWTKK